MPAVSTSSNSNHSLQQLLKDPSTLLFLARCVLMGFGAGVIGSYEFLYLRFLRVCFKCSCTPQHQQRQQGEHLDLAPQAFVDDTLHHDQSGSHKHRGRPSQLEGALSSRGATNTELP